MNRANSKAVVMFATADVELLAATIIDNWDEGGYTDSGYRCRYCAGHYTDKGKASRKEFGGFPHELICPVFVAQDVLTKT